MNENIIQNEQSNNGTRINMYYNARDAVWTAYGESAYALRLFVKKHGYDCLRGYSRDLQLPCTVVSEETVKKIRLTEPVLQETEGTFLSLGHEHDYKFFEYVQWAARMHEEHAAPTPFVVSTHVSSQVPKDGFIRDNMSSFSRNVKRIGDCLLALLTMIAFFPLFLICYIAVRLEDGGPAIFRQERIGRFGKPFYIYKFRSMRMDAEETGPQLSHGGGEDDSRLTKVGRFLRAHHLDELPQLWNVFVGDMSFIGPRPERQFYIDQILEYDKRYIYLYQIRPGVTSYATLYNGYTDTMEKMLIRLEYDLYYLSHRSWWFDFKVLGQTFLSIVFGKKF